MISHALTIVRNELDRHLATFGGIGRQVELGNVAELGNGQAGPGGRDTLLLTVVNIAEDKAARNTPAHVIDKDARTVRYEQPPLFLNLLLLVTATHTQYPDALGALSRGLAFFQHHPLFTHDTVSPQSLSEGAPVNDRDRLAEFRLVLSLWPSTLQEVNDLWGTLGGKQFPFALYAMRLLELKFQAPAPEGRLITDVVSTFGPR